MLNEKLYSGANNIASGTSGVRARVYYQVETWTDSETMVRHESAQVGLGRLLESEVRPGDRTGDWRRVESRRRGLVRIWSDSGGLGQAGVRSNKCG